MLPQMQDYPSLISSLAKKPTEEKIKLTRTLIKNDLYFLLAHICNRPDVARPWLFERCREIQAAPDGYLDLWAREHYKSTIITFGLTILYILRDPETTIGIFSFTRPAAKMFLKQIKEEFEKNNLLKELFPDVLYADPKLQSPVWGEEAIRVKRKGNPKEQTLEAWGVIDGQPTGRHFKLRVYDDVVSLDNVSNAEQVKKTTDAVKTSFALGTQGGRERFIGTRYAVGDTYQNLIDEGIVKVRIYPATDNGKPDGKPVLLTPEYLAEKRAKMGPYIFGCQMLQDPMSDARHGFKPEWLRYYGYAYFDWRKMNRYLLCDPAGAKNRTSDYTVMVVIGLGADRNKYLIDGMRDRMNLTERTQKLFEWRQKYMPTAVGYEKYGKDSDIEHIEEKQEELNMRFAITALGGALAKNDRIKTLQPDFEQGRFYMPKYIYYTDSEGKQQDFIKHFIGEYNSFPRAMHDDILDCIARINDQKLGAAFPDKGPGRGGKEFAVMDFKAIR
jgi:phage terminase large subunit-like protein